MVDQYFTRIASLGNFSKSYFDFNFMKYFISDDSVDSGNFGEVVNLVIMVILLNLVLFVDFLLW